MIGILASRADEASVAIARALLDHVGATVPPGRLEDRYSLDGAELRVVDDLHIELDGVDERFAGDPAWIAIVSRHAGDTGPLLTAHHPGNVASADYGGDPFTVPPACPAALAAYLHRVEALAPDGYAVGLECTHHGPTDCARPLMFVEIGSGPDQWADPAAARAVAEALWDVRAVPARTARTVVGLGGGHYAPRFHRILRETDWAVGHVAADWALADLPDDRTPDVLASLFDRSDTRRAVVDDRSDLHDALAALEVSIVSERWLRATSALSIPVVDALEAAVQPIDAGLDLGARRTDDPDALRAVTLPADLLETCRGIDHEATVAAVAAGSVAFATDEAASAPAGPIAMRAGDSLDPIVDRLVALLERKFDAVAREGEHLEARRWTFDPAKAAALGVPEGPLFGRLASGESVEVNGDLIRPTDVGREEVVSFDLPGDV